MLIFIFLKIRGLVFFAFDINLLALNQSDWVKFNKFALMNLNSDCMFLPAIFTEDTVIILRSCTLEGLNCWVEMHVCELLELWCCCVTLGWRRVCNTVKCRNCEALWFEMVCVWNVVKEIVYVPGRRVFNGCEMLC